jgi:hypothetical protein
VLLLVLVALPLATAGAASTAGAAADACASVYKSVIRLSLLRFHRAPCRLRVCCACHREPGICERQQ